jgi:hypothetical protein
MRSAHTKSALFSETLSPTTAWRVLKSWMDETAMWRTAANMLIQFHSICRISGSHDGGYEDGCLLVCSAV